MSPIFGERSRVERTTYGQVVTKLGTQLKVRYGPSVLNAALVAPLAAADVVVGDYVLLRWQADKAYAFAKLDPATISALIAGGTTAGDGGDGGTVPVPPPAPPPFDDSHLVWRDGSHSLYARARWLWEQGAEVNGVLRSWGTGLLQVFGALFVGRREGPHAGLLELKNDVGEVSAVLQATDSENRPVFSTGGMYDDDPDTAWCNIGREGLPRIELKTVEGYDRKIPQVPLACLAPDARALEDHGSLKGLLDDDHPQYYNEERGDQRYALVEHTHPVAEPLRLDFGERFP